jgi:hypothetical protein
MILADFNMPPSTTDRSSRQNKETSEINDTLDQMDVTDTYRALHPTAARHTFFSAAHRTFSKTDHILGHKASLNKYNKTEITLCILSGNNGIKLKLNNKSRKYSNTWRMIIHYYTTSRSIENIREEIKKFLESNENENTTYQNLWDTEESL